MNYYGRGTQLVARTRTFALRIIEFYSGLPRTPVAQVLGKQLLRSATSAGAQYREAQHAKSISDFVSKSEGSLQELEESAYWLELMEASKIGDNECLKNIYSETRELVSIFMAIVRSAKVTRARA
ncbi:MAG TPA: four helix bundle protein [Burkholderiales bacterium]|nr:four helix bundle protein [Burkholderiales bacterium]